MNATLEKSLARWLNNKDNKAATFDEATLIEGLRLALRLAEANPGRSEEILSWVKASEFGAPPPQPPNSAVWVSPGDACLDGILSLLRNARRSIDICVFTITDDRLTDAIMDAHKRGVNVRVISDDDKSTDKGSDIDRLARSGVPVRKDRSKNHMHHKFALFDGRVALTGSYNWTRSAANRNRENIITTEDRNVVTGLRAEFSRLWAEFAEPTRARRTTKKTTQVKSIRKPRGSKKTTSVKRVRKPSKS